VEPSTTTEVRGAFLTRKARKKGEASPHRGEKERLIRIRDRPGPREAVGKIGKIAKTEQHGVPRGRASDARADHGVCFACLKRSCPKSTVNSRPPQEEPGSLQPKCRERTPKTTSSSARERPKGKVTSGRQGNRDHRVPRGGRGVPTQWCGTGTRLHAWEGQRGMPSRVAVQKKGNYLVRRARKRENCICQENPGRKKAPTQAMHTNIGEGAKSSFEKGTSVTERIQRFSFPLPRGEK